MSIAAQQDQNDNHKEALLETIRNGKWCFNHIAPTFKDALLRKHPQVPQDISLAALTALTYRPQIILPLELFHGATKYPRLVPGEGSNQAWQALCAHFFEGTSVRAPLPSEDALWIESFCIIKDADPAMHASLESWISHICMVDGGDFRSASHPHLFGCLFMQVQADPTALAISLVHEMAHQELFLINLLDRLVEEGFDHRLIHAPFQGRERPPIGRIHSGYALFRMTLFERRIGYASLGRHMDLLDRTIATFSDNELTPFARSLIDAIRP
jgi:hypothetical protein